MSTKPKRLRRRSQRGSRATPTETTPPVTEMPPLTDTLSLTEKLGAKLIPADPNHPFAVQQQWDDLALQKAEKGARHGAKFSGGRQGRGDLWQVLEAIVTCPEFQGASWLPIMREAAKRLDGGRLVGQRLHYHDSSGTAHSIGSKGFQTTLSQVRRALEKNS